MSPANVTVWFDEGCPLCRREIALMRDLDWHRRLRFIDVAADGAECPVDRATALARFHAQEEGGPVVSGARAFAAMWRALPLLRPLGLLERLPPVLILLEWLYLGFLRVGPRLQSQASGGSANPRLVKRPTTDSERAVPPRGGAGCVVGGP